MNTLEYAQTPFNTPAGMVESWPVSLEEKPVECDSKRILTVEITRMRELKELAEFEGNDQAAAVYNAVMMSMLDILWNL